MQFVTTAIDYTNGAPHIGHAYEKLWADVITRYFRLRGDEAYFLTGVDQHGQKVQQSAEKEGVHPATFAKKKTKAFLNLWKTLGIEYDGWAATTDELHKVCVQKILTRLHDEGQIYKKRHRGFYSVRQEQFLTDKERNEEGEFGEEWGLVEERDEENYYFRLGDHIDWLKGAIDSDKFGILPTFRKAEVLNALERDGELDLCISRPKERLRWGIEIPFDTDFVTYVWFDALINYISFAGYLGEDNHKLPDFSELWPADLHIIGKDITVPSHAVYWPCMLHALGFADDEMPTLLVHGWWNISGEKMSKSLGNVIDPAELAETYGVDSLRYYLVRDIRAGKDADFDLERLIGLFNTELANKAGNLLNRTLNMTRKNLGGVLPAFTYDDDENSALRESLARATEAYKTAMNGYETSVALQALIDHIAETNAFIDRTEPWSLAKDDSQADRLASVLYHAAETCAHFSILLSPILPDAAARIQSQLKLEAPPLLPELGWGILKAGHAIGKPKPVFPKLELPSAEG